MTERNSFSAVPLADWDALPLPVRIADRLAEALVLAGELRAELGSEEAATLLWIAPEMDDVFERLDGALRCLSS